MTVDLTSIPARWFLYGLGESVKPIIYRGDKHDNTGEGYWCEVQHRSGGRLCKGVGKTSQQALDVAVAAAIQMMQERDDLEW